MSKTRIFEEMQEIRRLRVLGIPGYEIMRQMNLSRHCYQDRVMRMNKIDKEYVMNTFANEVGTEVIILNERMLSIIRLCDEIANDKSIETEMRLEALKIKFDCSVGLVKIPIEGPRIIKRELRDSIIVGESKLLELKQQQQQDKEEVFSSSDEQSKVY